MIDVEGATNRTDALAAALEEDVEPFTLTPFSAWTPPYSTGWLVDGVLPGVGAGMLFGPSGSGKSFVALDLMFRVAAGLDWFGHAVTSGECVYAPLEGERDLRDRGGAWLSGNPGNEHAEDRVHLVEDAEELQLNIPDRVKRLDKALRTRKLRPALIVVDTLSQAMRGVKENDNTEVKLVTTAVKDLAKRHGCLVIVVHHTGHEAKDRPRGATSFRDDLDVLLRVDGDGDGVRQLTCVKQKYAEPFAPKRFTLVRPPYSPPSVCVQPAALSDEAQALRRLAERAVAYVREHPGCASGEVYKRLGGKQESARGALAYAEGEGWVVNEGHERRAAWVVGST